MLPTLDRKNLTIMSHLFNQTLKNVNALIFRESQPFKRGSFLLTRPKVLLPSLLNQKLVLKDKSGVGIIVDYSRDYTVVDGV